MKASKKRERNEAKLAALLGLAPPDTRDRPLPNDAKNTASRGAQATLEFVHNPHKFHKVMCKECGQSFYVNRGQVACCSDVCAAKGLAKIGIQWDWHKPPESRWAVKYQGDKETNEPLIVPPEAVEVLRSLILFHGDEL